MYMVNSGGSPLHKSSTLVLNFISNIICCFCSRELDLIPYHGNSPFKKYIKMYPKLSRSSLLDYSYPLWAFMLAYLHVPIYIVLFILIIEQNTNKRLFVSERNVFVSAWISISLWQSKINGENIFRFLAQSNKKVFWFHVTMNICLEVNIFQVGYDLICYH